MMIDQNEPTPFDGNRNAALGPVNMPRVSIRMPPALLTRMKEVAEAEGYTGYSELVRETMWKRVAGVPRPADGTEA